jgi:hypothetical protein
VERLILDLSTVKTSLTQTFSRYKILDFYSFIYSKKISNYKVFPEKDNTNSLRS